MLTDEEILESFERMPLILPKNGAGASEDSGILFNLRQIEAKLDAKFGVESEAINRKLPEDRHFVKWHEELNMALLWASATMNTSCFATGFLGWELGLSLKQTISISILASIIGAAVSKSWGHFLLVLATYL